MFDSKPLIENKKTIEYLDSTPKRFNTYQNALAYYASQYLTNQIKAYIPSSKDTRDYIDSIVQSIVILQDKRQIAYAVLLNPRTSRIKKLDPNKSVIYIKSIKRLGKSDPKALILERYNPWTMDTIPFIPDKRNADIVTNKVSEITAQKIAMARNRDSIQWKKDLLRAGAVLPKEGTKMEFAKNTKAASDMSYEALRMEFGLDGKKSGSHWRRGVSDLISSGLNNLIKQKNLNKILEDPNFKDFISFVPLLKQRITPSEARSFSLFAKKLGIVQ